MLLASIPAKHLWRLGTWPLTSRWLMGTSSSKVDITQVPLRLITTPMVRLARIEPEDASWAESPVWKALILTTGLLSSVVKAQGWNRCFHFHDEYIYHDSVLSGKSAGGASKIKSLHYILADWRHLNLNSHHPSLRDESMPSLFVLVSFPSDVNAGSDVTSRVWKTVTAIRMCPGSCRRRRQKHIRGQKKKADEWGF